MRISIKNLPLALLLMLGLNSWSQSTDTLKVMSYNLLKFPNVASERIDTLKEILTYIKPDIFVVCELTSGAGADDILYNALNVNGETSYDMATYTDGPDTEGMLYYNSDKLALKEQNVIPTVLRDIKEYVLYYKSDDIATTEDTTFFYIYVCHLKASQGNESQRNQEAIAMKDYIATRWNRQNILIAGDFNIYGSSIEPAWNTILNGAGVTMKDPINTPGDWHANATYAAIHTQSTRTTSFDGGSTGGIDDRFDFIFISPDLTNWGNDAKYINGTYRAVGQDGQHYNDALIDAPWNTIEPASIIWNLYHMSDHLPVYMEIEVNKISMDIEDQDSGFNAYYVPDSNLIRFELTTLDHIEGPIFIYDMSGKMVMEIPYLPENNSVDVSGIESGMYVMKVQNSGFELKFVVE